MSKIQDALDDLINEARRTNATSISFESGIYRELSEIPEELYDLTSLEDLNLGSIQFSSFSEKILKLEHLTDLKISSYLIEEFPVLLTKMRSLEHLSMDRHTIKVLPKELNNWKELEYLYLGRCSSLIDVKGIPPNLTYLFIDGIPGKQVPEKIFDLMYLNKLVFKNSNLESLPTQLFELPNLRYLFLGGNNIREIPKEIKKLNLTELWLEDNEFSTFPKSILQLSKLAGINLRDNHLKTIPSDINKLSNLEYFDIGNNQFTNVPLALTELKLLKTLKFGNYSLAKRKKSQNEIKFIPTEILKLENLVELDIYNNPIEKDIPTEIRTDSPKAILNFLLSRLEAETEDFLYEAKMVIVGRGNVGKSVLTKKLTDPDYSLSNNATTIGIDILKTPFFLRHDKLIKTDAFKFNIWDFGGQEKYDATHQLFITNRSIYLFLTEAREESNYLDFYYWLNTIRLFSNNCPVIVVLSKCDERKKLLPESVYKEKFENIVEFVDISCADGYEHTIESLKKAIRNAVDLLPQTRQRLSNRWVEIRNELETLSLKKDYISYSEFLKICRQHKLDKKRAEFLSQFLNDLGVIIHRQHDLLLKKTVFIKPDWCVDGLYQVLDDQNVAAKKGLFNISDLHNIWKDKRYKDKQPELLKLMQEYNLCFELKDGSGFLVPDLLLPDKPKHLKWHPTSSNLQFEFQYDFMPAGILSRFIVKSHSFIKEDLYWKYGVVLEYDNTLALIEEDYIHSKIKVTISGENKKGLLSAVRMYINEVHRDFDKSDKLVFEEMVPCNCSECSKNVAPHFYKFTVLRKFEQKLKTNISCEQSGEDVRIQSLINDIQVTNPFNYITTSSDLKGVILSTILNTLVSEIQLKEGYRNFWRDKGCSIPKDETEIQPYISNVIDNYCKIRGIQLSREVVEANGRVDMLFSYTNQDQELLKVCVEVKRAQHHDVITALNTQLSAYMESSGADTGIYLVIWQKNDLFKEPNKYNTDSDLLKEMQRNIPNNISVIILNCNKPVSPSKKKS